MVYFLKTVKDILLMMACNNSAKKNINVQLPGLILKFKLKLELSQLILSSNGRVSHRLIVITHKGWDASKVSYWIHPSKIFLVVLDAVWGRALAALYTMVVLVHMLDPWSCKQMIRLSGGLHLQ